MTPFESALAAGLIVVATTAVLSSAALPIATALCRVWVWLLTKGICDPAKDRRRSEVESDVFEHRLDALQQGYAPHQVALQILSRLLLGVPGDLAWRADFARTQIICVSIVAILLVSLLGLSSNASLTLLAVRLWLVVFALAVTAGVSLSGYTRTFRRVRNHIAPPSTRTSIDAWILVAVAGLLIGGLCFIALNSQIGSSQIEFKRQAIFSIVGFGGLVFALRFNHQWLRYLSVPLLLVVLIALLLVLCPIGTEENGVRRWLSLGPIQLEPAEFLKLALLVYLAAWLGSRGHEITKFSLGFVPLVILTSTAVSLVFEQPDPGGATVIILVTCVLFYSSGAPFSHLACFLMSGAALSGALVLAGAHYGWASPLGDAAWVQATVHRYTQAISSGGSIGSGFAGGGGLGGGERDGMFAVVGEQGGMLAMIAIAGLYGLLIVRGFLASWRATDNMGFLLGLGITSWIGYQAILNVAGAVGSLPLSGQGLPFMSLGGSDTVVLLFAAGVLLNISRCDDDAREGSWTQLPLDWQPPSWLSVAVMDEGGDQSPVEYANPTAPDCSSGLLVRLRASFGYPPTSPNPCLGKVVQWRLCALSGHRDVLL